MGKVFRFHEGNNAIEDWQHSEAYGENAIQAITDPDGGSAHREITSIPSPFARIDLVHTAFQYVIRNRQLEGDTIYHQMISHSLDVGELFFNFDRFGQQLEIMVWDKQRDLKQLLDSSNPKHRLLGKTLELYLSQDQEEYNFDALNSLYFIRYKDGQNTMDILGGTSPVTLFFASANPLQCPNIQLGSRIVFQEILPFHKREFEFQKYIYGIKAFMPDFRSRFKVLDQFLDMSYSYLTNGQRRAINALTQAQFRKDYAVLDSGNEGNNVKVLDFTLCRRYSVPRNIEDNSDFVIDSTKPGKVGGVAPLVLPVEKINEKLVYTTDLWDVDTRAPYEDRDPLEIRKLPFTGDKYPYLTIGDFLEPYLIRTPYPLDKERFFDGNLGVANPAEYDSGYLLPLKKTFFDYFKIEDLRGETSDGKRIFEMKQVGEGIQVFLRIPVKIHDKRNLARYVSYNRIYYPPQNNSVVQPADTDNNKGVILENQLTLALFPFFRLEDKNASNHYRIGLISRDISPALKKNTYQLEFYTDTEAARALDITALKHRSNKDMADVVSDYYVLDHAFDYIRLSNNWTSGVIVPLFPTIKQGGVRKFTFAVDFGTSNTHIEYRVDNGDPEPFTIGKEDMQIASLHDPESEVTRNSFNRIRGHVLTDMILQEFSPYLVGHGHESRFPQRTTIVSHKSLDFSTNTFAMADLNIAFLYEKRNIYDNQKTTTNLKWADKKQNKLVEGYFEHIILYIRNKVLLNGGDLNQTELIWFYPASMMIHRKNRLQGLWKTLFSKYVCSNNAPKDILESVAPFYFYKYKEGVTAGKRPSVSIDIGGGTSDIVVYVENQPRIVTSFRFAANTIFGDGYNGSPANNGFVQGYLNEIRGLLDQNKQRDLLAVLTSLEKSKSEDICTFFFSLENNLRLNKENIPISFTQSLKDDEEFKIVFLLFYGAIVYHLAKLMKINGIAVPRYITFSGTGSKVLNVLDTNGDMKTLSRFTTLLFSKIYDSQSQESVTLKQHDTPKEITCKGGLVTRGDDDLEITDDMKKVLLGTRDNRMASTLTYASVTDDIEKEAEEEFAAFLDLLFDMDSEFSFNNNFGVIPAQKKWCKEFLKDEAIEFIKLGIKNKQSELENDEDNAVEETLFFYPLVGGLSKLANEINKRR